MIYSFDVFDTVVIRCYYKPTDLFIGLGRQLSEVGLISESALSFQKKRIDSEVIARKKKGGEITIDNIYDELSTIYQWSEVTTMQAKEIEISFELQCLKPNAQIIEKIVKLLDNNQAVCFISDMYLSKGTLQKAIKACGIENEVNIFVSSEYFKTKYQGDLFGEVFRYYQQKSSKFIHLGDNIIADYEIPIKLGMKARNYKYDTTRHESGIYESGIYESEFRSLLSGSMRVARLSKNLKSKHQQTIWDVSTNVIGPCLFFYVIWILRKSKELGIKRLYFVSRDGQILYKISEIIKSQFEEFDDIECRYLYGSRHAWHIPAIEEIGDRELDWIFDNTNFLSIESICYRVNLLPQDIQDQLSDFNNTITGENANLSQQQRLELKEIFRTNTEIQKIIIDKAAKSKINTIGYLKQEGLLDDVAKGVVDIGWQGRAVESLKKIISQTEYPDKCYGFFWGLFRTREEHENVFFPFYRDPLKPRTTDNLSSYFALMEMFCLADHGSVIGYKFEKTDYIPILNKNAVAWDLEIQQEGILRFCSEFAKTSKDLNFTQEDAILFISILLNCFFRNPTKDEANCFCKLKFFEDQTENISYSLFPKVTLMDVLLKNIPHHNYWREGYEASMNSFIRLIYVIRPKIIIKIQKIRNKIDLSVDKIITRSKGNKIIR